MEGEEKIGKLIEAAGGGEWYVSVLSSYQKPKANSGF